MDARDLRVALAMKGWRPYELARACGVTPATVSRWLHGAYPVPPERIEQISRVLYQPDNGPRQAA